MTCKHRRKFSFSSSISARISPFRPLQKASNDAIAFAVVITPVKAGRMDSSMSELSEG
jgi:hypothetical protein